MTALKAEAVLLGADLPRVGVDVDPALIPGIREDAATLGISLMPWQEYALGIMEAARAGSYQFPEVAVVVARQNGKSTMLAPLIRHRMQQGRRILHAAQDRIIPRRIFGRVAASFPKSEARIRLANGQEEITLPNGASYKIVASQRSGVRGNDADDLIVDELREQTDTDFIEAARPTVTASVNPQIIYLSNAGTAESIVLNGLRARGLEGVSGLAYLEWSADPELDPGDREGWAQSNPALGRTITLERLDSFYRSYLAEGNLAGWETEHMCRWVRSMKPRLVSTADWLRARKPLEFAVRPYMGVSCDPDGRRASAVLSWAHSDGSVGTQLLADVEGDPLDVDRFAEDLRTAAQKAGVIRVGFDPLTDAHLARYFPGAESLSGQTFTNAVERWVHDVQTGRLRWSHADQIGVDLEHAVRKELGGAAYTVERAEPRRPITAVLAAIRAHWLASEPDQGPPNIW